jgi:hypothetical protein
MMKADALSIHARPPLRAVAVSGREAFAAFLQVPFRLFRDDRSWVPPLLLERRQALDPAKNPYFAHAEVGYWIAERGGEPVGRISAQIDRAYLDRHQDATGHFGLLDGEDDPEAFGALLGAAEGWLRERGMRRATGPFSLSINEESGLLVDGFATPPMLLMGHARPYYRTHLERAGYRKCKDLHAYWHDMGTPVPAAIARLLERLRANPRIALRPLRRARYREDLATALAIFNDAWSGNWGFVPLAEAEIAHVAASLRPLIEEELVWFAEVDGAPAAMAVLLPNLNEAIADLGGRLLPFGWAKLLWRLKARRPATARVPLMGVRKAHNGTALGGALALAVIDAARRGALRAGIRHVEMSWVLEDNLAMRRIIDRIGARGYKTYRVYEKALV